MKKVRMSTHSSRKSGVKVFERQLYHEGSKSSHHRGGEFKASANAKKEIFFLQVILPYNRRDCACLAEFDVQRLSFEANWQYIGMMLTMVKRQHDVSQKEQSLTHLRIRLKHDQLRN
jgi:hypothetical protein